MSNALWRDAAGNIQAYTEDRAIHAKIRRSYGFKVAATYYEKGEVSALQYLVPAEYSRTVRRMFGVQIT
ncbi:hypothetical protein [Paenibacillus durus]|uniref:Uncharacterized protein n=1 Tax=Paenibacillus durus ATCC 35681 TaxID=1333534 RepID=A0A0F7FBG2_PAEDU|nr:hypothetical protein [Paenibacillus durus]AKG35650.1 hypothetical protein VK70_14585 [Paenibacillus durus ATCC 35681]